LDIDNIGAVVKAVKARENITFVVIDYMQLIRSESKGRNREQEVAYISNTCKRIAKECSVCVMALAQLSRDVEKRGGNKIPQLSDLRESGSIEQDADVVLFPFRPDYYLLGDENHNPAEIEDAKVIVAKCRNGMTGYIDVKFKPSTTQYIL
jgi:replicative DNA helicase